MGEASLRSYHTGSYKSGFTVTDVQFVVCRAGCVFGVSWLAVYAWRQEKPLFLISYVDMRSPPPPLPSSAATVLTEGS